MDLFREMAAFNHQQVVVCHERSCGYLGIIAIHDTTLGPALGGLLLLVALLQEIDADLVAIDPGEFAAAISQPGR